MEKMINFDDVTELENVAYDLKNVIDVLDVLTDKLAEAEETVMFEGLSNLSSKILNQNYISLNKIVDEYSNKIPESKYQNAK
ncbi:hypothetical protein ACFSJM_03070 [Lactococcus formosensis subsp. bovis]|uniref:hypothetical protein n=1 Tax=Lactococcus formosensis TaxID=1281486 RepID=UPI001BCC9CDB|nr:hypothetical protein [Lactococcus formosensis]